MEHHNTSNTGMAVLDLGERVAALETKMERIEPDLKEIKDKLDELLHLKSKGMGALYFVGILLSSGLIGIVTMVLSFLNGHRAHL